MSVRSADLLPAAHQPDFGFHYRIEIDTPESKRVRLHVFPFLFDGELVDRVDSLAERAAERLLVPGAFAEPGYCNPGICRRAGRRVARDGRLA